MKQNKRYVIQFKSGNYLENEWPVSSTHLIGEAKIFTKKKEAAKVLVENLQAWYHPGAQILKYHPPTPGGYKPLKQKTKLKPVTHWMPLKASNEPKPVTDSEPTEQRGASREVNYNYRVGLGLLMVAYSDLTSKSEGDTVTVTVTHRPSNWLKEDILAIEGWYLKTKSNAYDEVYWEWLFVPSEVSKPKPVTDSEVARLDSSKVARWHYDEGIKLLGEDLLQCLNWNGETAVYSKVTEGDSANLISAMASHGFKLRGWGKWSFKWNRWEAKAVAVLPYWTCKICYNESHAEANCPHSAKDSEAKETEAETDSTCSVCDSTPDQCHAEAHCPKMVS